MQSECVSSEAEVFSAIHFPGTNLCVWKRDLPAEINRVAGVLAVEEGLAYDLTVAVGHGLGSEFLKSLSKRCPFEARPTLGALLGDMNSLIRIFASVAQSSLVRVRLESVQDLSCSRFHRDYLKLRMLCTYAGPGTQWVSPDNLREEVFQKSGSSNEEMIRDMTLVKSAGTGHVLLMKGHLHPDGTPGVVHRSWPVCCDRDYRLRLCLDPID
ncbi:DUF1826 domain-containing protein [Kamptonema cortianum]|nr:DUF1826 domain-containing protein [Kamptonema cortianum]